MMEPLRRRPSSTATIKITPRGVDTSCMTRHRGIPLLFGVAVALALPLIATSPATAWTTDPNGTLIMVSTPDEPYVGGRHFDVPSQRIITNTSEQLFVAFMRQDPWGALREADPPWGVSIASPATLLPNTEYPLDGTELDVLRLTDDLTWYSDVCPDMTGGVTFHELSTSTDGVTAVLSASFVLHCTPEHSVFGSLAFGTELPALSDDALKLVADEARYPSFAPEGDGGFDEIMAIDVHRTRLFIRWDTPVGFRCVDARATRDDDSLVSSYDGRDDTWLVPDLDPAGVLRVRVALGQAWPEPCWPGSLTSDYETVLPITTHLTRVEPASSGHLALNGRAVVTVPRYHEPARSVEVTAKGRRPDGSTVLLGTTVSGDDGRYHLVVRPRHSVRVWTVVAPGKDPAAPESLRTYWYHFGDRSTSLRSPLR